MEDTEVYRFAYSKPHSQMDASASVFDGGCLERKSPTCSLCYFKGEETLLVIEGLYNIVVNVLLLAYHISKWQLMAYFSINLGGHIQTQHEQT
jgi:hypothetical protein